jgi:hypothetical protein
MALTPNRLPRDAASGAPYGPPPGARFAALHADVTARLRGVCAEMAPEAFARLVHDICVMKLRWDAEAGPDRRA